MRHRESRRRRSRTRTSRSRSEGHTSELQSPCNLVCRLLLEKKKQNDKDSKLISIDQSPSALTNARTANQTQQSDVKDVNAQGVSGDISPSDRPISLTASAYVMRVRCRTCSNAGTSGC